MIQANDLRIGNYVYLCAVGHEDEPDILQWGLEDFEFYSDRMCDIKPIPLTHEILLKCGMYINFYIS